MKLLKNIWTYVAAIFVFLAGFLVLERGKRKNAEARLGSAEADKTDAVLENEEKHVDADIRKLKEDIDALEKNRGKPAKELSDKEIEEYWKNNS